MSERKITIDVIARDLGISKTTVSRAISGKGRIGQATINRVNEYCRQNNYHPSAIAKSLASCCSNNIAYVVTKDLAASDIPTFQHCMWGVSEYASQNGYDIILCTITDGDYSSLERLVNDRKIDGAIIGRAVDEDATLEYLRTKDIPFVTIGSLTDESTYQVDNNHMESCMMLTQNLLSKGLKKLSLLGGNSSYNINRNRLAGFIKAHRNQRVDTDQKMIFRNLKNDAMIEEAVRISLVNKADCIVCMDDTICSKVLNYLDRSSIRIPSDIKVASFTDSILLQSHVPAVTAIHSDITELGKISCMNLLTLIKRGSVATKQIVKSELIERDSTRM